MNYQLLLDRRSIALSLLGFAAVGTLLFLAGFLVAARWYEDQEPMRAPRVVRGPTLDRSPSALEWFERGPAPTAASSRERPEQKLNSLPMAVAYAQAPPEEAPVEPASSDAAARSAAPRPAPDSFAADVSYQEEPDAYSVQAGAFLSEFNLESFVDELESTGYEPYVVRMSNADRVLLSVRIGKFATREQAQRAASEFATKFGRSAVVREPVSP